MPYLTVEEFADEFGFTRAEVRNHICDGMPAEPLGGDGPRVIDEEEALEWLEARDLVEDAEEDELDEIDDESDDD